MKVFSEMKKLLYLATLTLAVTSADIRQVAASGEPGNYRISHLVNSVAIPNDFYATDATHKISVHVQGASLQKLKINVPQGIRINREITVINPSGENPSATVSLDEQIATISFSQPIEPDTKLFIKMNGVNTVGYNKNWQYRVYAQKQGFTEVIPLGIAQIQTYR